MGTRLGIGGKEARKMGMTEAMKGGGKGEGNRRMLMANGKDEEWKKSLP